MPSKIVRVENDIELVQLSKSVQEMAATAQTLLQIRQEQSKLPFANLTTNTLT